MAAALSDFLPDVLAHTPQCPSITAERELLKAAIEFCRKSGAWYEDLDTFEAEVGKSTYDVFPPAGQAQIVRLREITIDGDRIDNTDEERLNRLSRNWRADTGEPDRWYQPSRTKLSLYPTPDAVHTVGGVVALMPTMKATRVPDFLFEEWSEGLAAGAVQRLVMMPGKAWSNPNLAASFNKEFRRAISRARIQALRGRSGKPMTVFQRPF